jgi:Tol biopolymer transport system component
VRRRSSTDFEQVQEASIYVVQSDGSGLRRLTPPGMFAGSPTWSADGARVAFYEMTVDHAFDARFGDFRPNAVSQIVSVDISSGVRTEITTGPGLKVAPQFALGEVAYLLKNGDRSALAFTKRGSGPKGSMRNPAWSPDGKSVVYQKLSNAPRPQNQAFFSSNAKFELASSSMFPAFSRSGRLAVTTDFNGADYASLTVMDADGSHARKLVDEPGAMAFAATWSPDGQRIAFGFGGFFANGTLPARIMMMPADGTDRSALTNGPANAGFPSFSESGEQIVYRVAGEQERGLRILSLKDGSIETLTTESDNFPAWSPAGGAIEFTRAIDGAYDIFSVRPDGTNLRRLTTAPGNDAHGVWSPDGSHIVFSSARLGFRDESPLYDPPEFQPYGELFIMNADGSDQRPLTDNKDEEGTPAWQPAPAAQ